VRRGAVLVLSVAAALGTARGARADDADTKRICAADHERTQRLRLLGKLREARRMALACAQEGCPAVVRAECAGLQAELDAALPSIVLEVRDASGDRVSDAVAELDGVALGRLEEQAITMDPGEHSFRVVVADGRAASQSVLVREGEPRRLVVVRLPHAAEERPREPATSGAAWASDPANPARALGPPAPPAPSSSVPPWPAYALGGFGLVGLGSFAFFGLRGYREQVSMESSCAPRCAPGSDDAMRFHYLAADLSLVAGVVALAAATWVYFAREPPAPRGVALAR
jgi:hypothetical protein